MKSKTSKRTARDRKRITSDFVLDLGLGEDGDPRKKLQGVYEPVVVGVPHHEGRLPSPKDVLELGQVDAEVVAN